MAIKNDREYRNFASFDIVEMRAENEGETPSMIVEGYASTFETYDLFTFENEVYREKIERNAFDDADMSDVVFLRDHTGTVLARTKNNLVNLSIDDGGLFTRTDLSKTEAARAMYEDIKAKNYTQMSFAFISDRNAETWTEEKEGDLTIYTRSIGRIEKLFDISAVAFPANPTTDIGLSARSLFDGAIEQLRTERFEKEREIRRRAAIALKLRMMEAGL